MSSALYLKFKNALYSKQMVMQVGHNSNTSKSPLFLEAILPLLKEKDLLCIGTWT